jgi:hypothetical protein
VGTGPIHEDPGCRALNEECEDRSGPVVRKRSIARGRRKRHLSSAISRKRRDGGVPSQRETHRKSGSPDRTAPSTPPPDVAQGSKPLPGPRRKRKSAEKAPRIDGESVRGVARRRKSRRDGAANGRHRNAGAGGPAGPPPAKIPNFRPHKHRPALFRHARRSSQSAPEGPPPATTNGELAENRARASPKGRDRLRPPPTPQKGPTGDSPLSARGANRQKRKISTPERSPSDRARVTKFGKNDRAGRTTRNPKTARRNLHPFRS